MRVREGRQGRGAGSAAVAVATWTVAAMVLVAGCLGGPRASPGPEAPQPGEEATGARGARGAALGPAGAGDGAAGAAMTQAGCRQLHTFYDAPALLFEGLLPEGFAVRPGDPAGLTATVGVAVSHCAEAWLGDAALGPVADVWVQLDVVPPEAMRGEGVDAHLLALEAYADHDAIVEAYRAWGMASAQAAEVTWAPLLDAPMAPVHTRVGVEAAAGDYQLHTIVPRDPGPFHDGHLRIFLAQDRVVSGLLDVAWPGGTQVGLGSATLRFQGNDLLAGAPPLSAGLAHQVEDVAMAFTPGAGAAGPDDG